MTAKVTVIGKDGHVYGDDEVVKVPRDICQRIYDLLEKDRKEKSLVERVEKVEEVEGNIA